jgi:hypothetical protein
MEQGKHAEDASTGNIGLSHRRAKSQPITEFLQDPDSETDNEEESRQTKPNKHASQRRIEVIRADERRFREIVSTAVKQALEKFSDEVWLHFISLPQAVLNTIHSRATFK